MCTFLMEKTRWKMERKEAMHVIYVFIKFSRTRTTQKNCLDAFKPAVKALNKCSLHFFSFSSSYIYALIFHTYRPTLYAASSIGWMNEAIVAFISSSPSPSHCGCIEATFTMLFWFASQKNVRICANVSCYITNFKNDFHFCSSVITYLV